MVVITSLLIGAATAQPPTAESVIPQAENGPVEPMPEPTYDGGPPAYYDGDGGVAYPSWLDNTYFRLQAQTDHGMGDVPGFFSLGMTNYFWRMDGVLMTELDGRVTNYGGGGLSAGFQRRIKSGELILGAGGFYDVSSSENNFYYQQAGISLEALYGLWGLRSNGYVPFGERGRNTGVSDLFIDAGNPRFLGNNIIADANQIFSNETSFGGYEFELSRSVYSLLNDVYGGFYHLEDDAGNKADGWKVGMRGFIFPALQGNITFSEDKVFGSNLYGGFTWFFGRGYTGSSYTMDDKMTLPVIRNRQVAVKETDTVVTSEYTFTDPDTGLAIEVLHVGDFVRDAGAALGTWENPYQTLTGADGANAPNYDIVYVWSDQTFTNQTFTMLPDQQMLGEGVANAGDAVSALNRHLVAVGPAPAGSQFVNAPLDGYIFMPGSDPDNNSLAGLRPILENNAGATITLADQAILSNFTFNNSGTATAVLAPNVGGADEIYINRLAIDGGATGIDIQGGTATFNISAVTINDATTAGVNIDGGAADVKFGSAAPTDLDDLADGNFGASSITQDEATATALVIANHGAAGSFIMSANSTITATDGDGLDFDSADGTYNFLGAISLTDSVNTGVNIIDSDGDFTFANMTIASTDDVSFNVVGGGGDINYNGGSINRVGGGNEFVVNIQDRTGGIVDFDVAVNASGNSGGINLVNNAAGSEINFNNTVNMGTAGNRLTGTTAVNINNNAGDVFFDNVNIFTDGENGFVAQNGGLVTVDNGTINTDDGQALILNNVEADVNFDSIVANDLTGPAVFIQALTANSAVLLENINIDNVNGAGDAGTAIRLVNNDDTASITIDGGTIDDTDNHGIHATNTNNLTINDLDIGLGNNVGGSGILVESDGASAREVAINNIAIDTEGDPAIQILGAGANDLTVTDFNNILVEGGSGGIVFDTVDLDSINANNIQIGQNAGARVQGAGITFNNVTGDFEVNTLTIFNNAGTGLAITGSPNFSMDINGGTINTTGATAILFNGVDEFTLDNVTVVNDVAQLTIDGDNWNNIDGDGNNAANYNENVPGTPGTGTIEFNGGADVFP